ncbi:uncharacterized protein V1518DRAFT_373633 [Limtongia smithiae]|uniref:uncharacterized protein n=1 Tax=Limtongia smithiae TaxID=1125753 RepID=UPI0034CDCE5C
MSIDISWSSIDPEEHARISAGVRDFLDEQFQRLTLPSYIASVSVLAFDIGSVAPEIEIKHIGDPYPEFYEDMDSPPPPPTSPPPSTAPSYASLAPATGGRLRATTPNIQFFHTVLSPPLSFRSPLQASFHSLPGLITPPANASLSSRRSSELDQIGVDDLDIDDDLADDASTTAPPLSPFSTGPAASAMFSSAPGSGANSATRSSRASPAPSQPPPFSVREEDIQFLLHIRYGGDVRIVLSATLNVNYPSPGFLTLPVRLTVSGVEVDAMAVLTHIAHRVHFSFISDVGGGSTGSSSATSPADGGLPASHHFEVLRNIRVESEIGDQAGKGSVLKNVGKVERFVLDRLRAIVRDELAWPGWITFQY